MIELRNDTLVFSFPEVHPWAVLHVEFQRTLRIPDGDRSYPLPPGLGRFPLRHVDDFAARVTPSWLERGGVVFPMYQSEAMWINFTAPFGYPFAVKVGTGKINAVTGEGWRDRLSDAPQDYVSVPKQPWLDGYCVEKGRIRQFVAMPLGSGYSVEEQLTGAAEHGGVQLLVHPLRKSAFRPPPRREGYGQVYGDICLSALCEMPDGEGDMGLGAGGMMDQEIYDDPQDFADWDLDHRGRCFVHLANALVWRAITGEDPPTTPPTAEEYTRHGLPWFDYYDGDQAALAGGARFGGVRSVAQLGKDRGEVPLPENVAVDPANVVHLRKGLAPGEVREGRF